MKKIKCFISFDSNTDTNKLEAILYDLGVEILNLYDFAIGSSFEDIIKRKIREADFVIAFVNNESKNVLFDVGMAEAFEKPIFLLVNQDVKVPLYLEKKMYFKIDWTKDTRLLELSLKNYIEDISNNLKLTRKLPNALESLSIDDTNEKLITLKNYRNKRLNEFELTKIILDVFSKINIQAVSELSLDNRSRVDIAISNENLSHFFGNPILIEIKAGDLSVESIDNAQLQLLNYINKTDAYYGILLYLDSKNKRFKSSNRHPNILIFDIEDFIQGISSYGLERLLLDNRNDLVHGYNSLDNA